ncbi:hypothetical protein PIB30_037278 [Stylosanthes scabra]|uniref:Uncharacterized protein n=1 Tax=Stylosanthes scabra TaxID=79078 RepID=A0ABU6VCH4_9FABA|nr:hypothetical protein [Stylosanthes scabra]
MRRMNNENEDEVLANDQSGLQLNDESNEGHGGVVLKKGPWTTSEDAMLVDYVNKHGEGNWNAVQKYSGLLRCGKSCRLRWANHLRPNLKKGAFTAEEERLIAELHAKMGNKWARMAAHLPGRTDNEIKNYWNTRIKRRQRAGLPLYPPEVCVQAVQENQHGRSSGGINGGNKLHHDFVQKNYEIHSPIFDGWNGSQGILPYAPELPDISAYTSMLKGFDSSDYCNFEQLTSANHKRLRESTTPFIGSGGMSTNWFYPFDQIRDNTSDKIAQSFGMQSPFDLGPSPHSSICYSHSLSNGNSSTSKPTYEAVKFELPSLQYPETDVGSWSTSPPPPLLESVDDFIQSPMPLSALDSDCSSPQNSGLLDALLYQARTLSSSKNHYSDKSSNSSTATPCDRALSSTLNKYETDWDDYTDTVSPFGATSMLNEYPAASASANSLDERPTVNSFNDKIVKTENVDQVWSPNSENQGMSAIKITRPDVLLASDWLQQGSERDMKQGSMADDISALCGDDLATDYKHTSTGTSRLSQVWGLGSCARNIMPALCEDSDRD